ncbi:MAG: hypothetical protein MK132_19440 [Lentisphaerales bacterium]|nr:hypothetical protein [Lentisphaerales bacterium]
MGTKKTIISISMYRLRCHDCGKYLMENIPFISSAINRISKVLERSILDLRKEMSIVRDLYSGATLFVGRGKSGDTLNEFAAQLKR